MLDAPPDTPPPPAHHPQPAPAPSRWARFARELVDTLLLTAVIFLLVNAATGRFMIRSVSMLPTLHEGEYVIVDKVSYLLRPPQRGDVVVLAVAGEEEDLIKRIIGLPGETIGIDGAGVTIDGAPLAEPYLASAMSGYYGPRALGPDEYFVMGDNRVNSKDSRVLGPIDRDSIVGRAWVIYWPPADWGLVPQPVYAEGQ